MSQSRQSEPVTRPSAAPATFDPAKFDPAKFDIEAGLFSTSRQDTIHTLFAPLHYESGYSYPLLVWLHGPKCDERQLLRIMPLISMRNYAAVAPRGLVLPSNVAHRAATTSQEEVGDATFTWPHDDDSIQTAEQRVFDAIDISFRRFNIDPQRVFLAGFDCGGTMALRVAMNHPYKFAGVLSLGGAFPTGRTPLSRLPEARQLPIFLAAGRQSTVYGETSICEDLRLLHTAGISITLRLYPCGHEISPTILNDVDRWIIEQITATKAKAEA